jgi:tetratricopeptide (TPR) repeat protein
MKEQKNAGYTNTSIIFLCIDLLLLALAIAYTIVQRKSFLDAYNGVTEILPLRQKIFLMISPYFFSFFMIVLLCKELLKNKIVTMASNLAAMVIIAIFGVSYVLTVSIPIQKLAGKQGGPARVEENLLYKALADVGKGMYAEGIKKFDRLIEINPRMLPAYVYRGAAYAQKGEYDKALSDYNKAIEINPRYEKAYVNMGLVYDKKGDYDRAIVAYDKVLEVNARYNDAYFLRAKSYFNKKKYDKSWDDVHKAVALGFMADAQFIETLKKASGREE